MDATPVFVCGYSFSTLGLAITPVAHGRLKWVRIVHASQLKPSQGQELSRCYSRNTERLRNAISYEENGLKSG